jgi:hypothetical protein
MPRSVFLLCTLRRLSTFAFPPRLFPTGYLSPFRGSAFFFLGFQQLYFPAPFSLRPWILAANGSPGPSHLASFFLFRLSGASNESAFFKKRPDFSRANSQLQDSIITI